VTNVGLKLVNQYELLYQASVSELASLVVYDGGLALTYAGDYPALSSLVAAPLSPGYYATCLSQGIARLGGSPFFQITADAADASVAADLTASAVVQRMLDAFGVSASDINAASFAALQSASPAAVGIVVNEENCSDAIATVLSSVGAVLVPTVLGEYRVVQLAAPAAGSHTLTLRELSEDTDVQLGAGTGDWVPIWSIAINCERVWQTQGAGDLAGAVSDARKAYLSTAYRVGLAQDSSVKTAHLLAREAVLDSVIATKADADVEAARLLVLHKVRRDRIAVAAAMRDLEGIQIGDSVTVKISRFGWSGGKNFVVVGQEHDFGRRQMRLTLWG
jgi:hypothetical protein